MRTLPVLFLLAACNGAPTGDTDDAVIASDPIIPVGNWNGPTFSELLEVEVWGTKIAFCSGVQGFQLWEAADPTNMQHLDDIGFAAGSGQYPRCQRVAVDAEDEVVWVTNHGDQIQPQPFLAAIDASSPTALREVVSLPRSESLEGLAVNADHVFVAAHDDGLLIFDKTTAQAPAVVGQVALANAWNVVVHGNVAYVANGQFGLGVVDISDPSNPVVSTEIALNGVAKDLVVAGERLYVATGGAGVAALDIASPTNPILIEEVRTPGSALAVAYDSVTDGLFIADWTRLRAYDASNPDELELIGTEALIEQDSRTLGIAARDGIIFSSNWTQMSAYAFDPSARAPDLLLSPPQLDLPNTDPGESNSTGLILSNDGSLPLTIEALVPPAGVTASELPGSLEPGQTTTITLTYTATNANAWRGDLMLQTNDVDTPIESISMSANQPGLGVGDPVPTYDFTDLNGTTFTVDNAGGEVTLLAYFATF